MSVSTKIYGALCGDANELIIQNPETTATLLEYINTIRKLISALPGHIGKTSISDALYGVMMQKVTMTIPDIIEEIERHIRGDAIVYPSEVIESLKKLSGELSYVMGIVGDSIDHDFAKNIYLTLQKLPSFIKDLGEIPFRKPELKKPPDINLDMIGSLQPQYTRGNPIPLETLPIIPEKKKVGKKMLYLVVAGIIIILVIVFMVLSEVLL